MQRVMEAGEQEYNDLMEEFSPPSDWDNPQWDVEDKVHNWRNYASEGLQREWQGFTGRQKIIISSNLDYIAATEHWD